MRLSILNTALWILIALFLSINITSAVTGRSFIAVVNGASMEPILSTGDIVFISPVNSPSDIRVGDVIIYKSASNRLVIHRVISIVGNGDYFITKGDNNPIPDPLQVPYTSIVGKVFSVNGIIIKVPYLGVLSLIKG